MAIILFPQDFKWGTATAAYQIEGAYKKDGRGMSIWDTFSHTPGKVVNGDNGNVACDSYNRVDEDVKLLKQLGVGVYRFSIAWPRIYPHGTGKVNPKGLKYYHKLVDKLIENGIEPFVTLYHWDLPQTLQDRGGWGNRETADAFVQYAETVFQEFGGKIKSWITFNEPWCISILSNYLGEHAPGYTDLQLALDVAHHVLLAHGKTVLKFRELGIEGQIGYAPNVEWSEPYSSRPEDVEAARRKLEHFNSWFLDPVFKGAYPVGMSEWYAKKGVRPPVQDGDLELIAQPIDFLGINYYSGSIVRHKENEGLFDCESVDVGFDKTDFGWNVYPEGFYKVLSWLGQQYGNIPIYITENGACYEADKREGRVNDAKRIEYLKRHMIALHRAIASGVNVKGYMLWSLMDNFEWAYGYTKPFGLVHVDFQTLERTKKDSFYWYRKLIETGWLDV